MRKIIDRHPLWCAFILMFICLAPIMALRDFSPSNELRYLNIADEAISGDHIFAFTNQGNAYADKPPLYFWIVMFCRLLFGKHSMFALSLFSFIPACVIIDIMDRWTFRRREDCTERGMERFATAMMLGTAGLFLGMSVFLRMDMLMCMFIVLALYAFHEGKPLMFAVWTFMALFTKGPVGLLVPPVTVIAYMIASHKGKDLGRWFGWRFWAVLAGGCAVWFAGVAIDGGKEYLNNLVVHQTVGRAVNSFHHKAPVWYYLAMIWGLLAPYCLALVPAAVLSFIRKDGRRDEERLFAWTVLCTIVMLSLFSSKLGIYLAPVFPFMVYLFPLFVERKGYSCWMKWAFGVPAALWCIIGAAIIAVPEIYGNFEVLSIIGQYGFARHWLLKVAGACMLAGGIYALAALKKDWKPVVVSLAASLLLTAFIASPLLPQANDYIGYGNLCKAVPEGAKVYTWHVHRPENMDVYLGHDINILSDEDMDGAVPADGVLILPERRMTEGMDKAICAKVGDFVIIDLTKI